jgi:hypothetical protein
VPVERVQSKVHSAADDCDIAPDGEERKETRVTGWLHGCDFIYDLLQIAGAISCPHCGSYHNIILRFAYKSHIKSLV